MKGEPELQHGGRKGFLTTVTTITLPVHTLGECSCASEARSMDKHISTLLSAHDCGQKQFGMDKCEGMKVLKRTPRVA